MPNKHRVALVTGGAKRVGRAIVEKLADAGFDVAFTFHSSQGQATELKRSIGNKILPIQADLSDPVVAVEAIHQKLFARFSRLDVLVNNASSYAPARLADTDVQLMRRLMTIHFEAPLLLCQKFGPMLRAAHGHVVNMGDHLAEKPWPEYMAYCASKAALTNLTLSLARELAPEVTVNAIAPGVVDWPDDFPQDKRAQYLKRVPLNRAGTPDDVANLVHFLCSAGSYITGQIIRLDGGRSIM